MRKDIITRVSRKMSIIIQKWHFAVTLFWCDKLDIFCSYI